MRESHPCTCQKSSDIGYGQRGKRTEGSTVPFKKIQVPEEVAKYQMEKLSDKFTTLERMSVSNKQSNVLV